MGHERVGALPKSRRWREIVEGISQATRGEVPVASLTDRTLNAVRSRFTALKTDQCTFDVFAALVRLASSCKGADDRAMRSVLGTETPATPLAVARFLHRVAQESDGKSEYGELVGSAGGDAVAEWFRAAKSPEEPLFESLSHPFETWRGLSTGAGFCELSRLFFARCTERYLNYFLEREASAVAPDIGARERLRESLEAHFADTSRHAFETSKITQSFAAGWFNKNAKDRVPERDEIRGFIVHSFEKLREALAREATAE